jgi:hypothetical protein
MEISQELKNEETPQISSPIKTRKDRAIVDEKLNGKHYSLNLRK